MDFVNKFMFNCRLALVPLASSSAEDLASSWRKGMPYAHLSYSPTSSGHQPFDSPLFSPQLRCYTFNIFATSCPHSLSDCEKCTGAERVVSRSRARELCSPTAFLVPQPNTAANMAKSAKSGNSTPAKVLQSAERPTIVKKPEDYTSEGVEDHDVFLLPGSDYQAMIAVTVLATIVRLFRIYQPSSVVFDEVQCVSPLVCDILTTID